MPNSEKTSEEVASIACERQLRMQGFWQIGIHNFRQECYRENGKNECIVRFKSNAIKLGFKEGLPVL